MRYSLLFRGTLLIQDAAPSLKVDAKTLGPDPKVKTSSQRVVDQQLDPSVKQKIARIHEHFKELRLEMEGGYAVVFNRATKLKIRMAPGGGWAARVYPVR